MASKQTLGGFVQKSLHRLEQLVAGFSISTLCVPCVSSIRRLPGEFISKGNSVRAIAGGSSLSQAAVTRSVGAVISAGS